MHRTSAMATVATLLYTKQVLYAAHTQEHTRMGGQGIGHRDMPCSPTPMHTRRACMSWRLMAMLQCRAPPRVFREVLNPWRQAMKHNMKHSEVVAMAQQRRLMGTARNPTRQMLMVWACWLGMSPAARAAESKLGIVEG